MLLEQKINEGIKTAMLAKDKLRLEALRAVKAAILLAKTAENPTELDEVSETKMLQKLVRQRRETAEIYLQNNRRELADRELAEAAVIEEFLPKQMSEEEIEAAVKAAIAETGAITVKDTGKVIGKVSKQLAGKADGRLISDTVKKLLQ
ncbi:MAG: GatB/YqeY domain-containing protein [Prevotellaceae bacterium]|nr:GatB/YqeY domain-containing protein [Prevotellaceae bacterium]